MRKKLFEFLRRHRRLIVAFLAGVGVVGAGAATTFLAALAKYDLDHLGPIEQALNEPQRLEVIAPAVKWGGGALGVVTTFAVGVLVAYLRARKNVRQLEQDAADRAVAVGDQALAAERTAAPGRDRKDTRGVLLGIEQGQQVVLDQVKALADAAVLFGHPANPHAQQLARDQYRLLLATARTLSSMVVDLLAQLDEYRKAWRLPEEPPVKIAPADAPPIETVIPELKVMGRNPLEGELQPEKNQSLPEDAPVSTEAK